MHSLRLAPSFLPHITSLHGSRLLGRAFTVSVLPLPHVPPVPRYSGVYVDAATKDSIIVVSAPPDAPNAVFGGLLALRALKLGVRGAVIDGRARDLQEIKQMDFPVFARATSVLSAQGHTFVSAIQVPITISNVTIHPNDIIVGDMNGVVVVPAHALDAVIDMCAQLVAQDNQCANDVRAGSTLQEAFTRHRTPVTPAKMNDDCKQVI